MIILQVFGAMVKYRVCRLVRLVKQRAALMISIAVAARIHTVANQSVQSQLLFSMLPDATPVVWQFFQPINLYSRSIDFAQLPEILCYRC
jgi:hypothetical protein